MLGAEAEQRTRTLTSADLPPAVFSALWLVGVAAAWWAVTQNQLSQTDLDSMLGADAGASLVWLTLSAVLSRFFMLGLEALFYCAWWRSWGARFRWWPFFATLAALSLIDAWAETLQAWVRDSASGLAPWLAPVLGLGVLHERGAPGTSALTLAFASLGVATAARVALTARAQARETGRGIVHPLLLTTAAWLLTRLVMWWMLDLARGMSPVP